MPGVRPQHAAILTSRHHPVTSTRVLVKSPRVSALAPSLFHFFTCSLLHFVTRSPQPRPSVHCALFPVHCDLSHIRANSKAYAHEIKSVVRFFLARACATEK
jgi:hypothetical protein